VRALSAPRRAGGPECGAASAEFALTLPVIMLVLITALTGVAAAVDQVRCVDAARLAARALARGDSGAAAVGLAARAAPAGARVSTAVGADLVRVTVTARRSVPGSAVGWDVSATATAPIEYAAGLPP
jgi:hypothetical protein